MISKDSKKYLVLCGGVGGAKLALGLSRMLQPDQMTVVVNTGDDFEHLGLTICPDIDTVTYTLAGLVDPQQGWGRSEETWNALEQVESFNADTWFRLGDKDIGLHLVRRSMLDSGISLTDITAHISNSLGIGHLITPMSDNPVRTLIEVDGDLLPFQHYFVRERCLPRVKNIHFSGAKEAKPSAAFKQALNDDCLAGVIICPSNPYLSIDPILSIPGIQDAIKGSGVPVIAISPIVKGTAIKGPTVKIMREMNIPVTQQAIIDHYYGLINGIVLDSCDTDITNELRNNVEIHSCKTVMKNLDDKVELAKNCLNFIDVISKSDA